MAEKLPFSKLFRISDALGRVRRELNLICGDGTGIGLMYSKFCELVAVDQSGSDGVYTIRARDFVDSFAVGDDIGFWDTSAKIRDAGTVNILTIKSIDRSTNQITADTKFTNLPVITDFLILFNTLQSVGAKELEEDYILDLNVSDQVVDLLEASVSIAESLRTRNLIHPAVRTLIETLNTHYESGINNQLEDHTNPEITHPTNSGIATVDLPDDYAKWFTVGDEVTYYDVSAGNRLLESEIITIIGAAGSGTDANTTLITLTDTWAVSPASGDFLMIYDRVDSHFRLLCDKIGITLTKDRVFPPEVELGTYVATGAAAGTFTDGDAVDTEEYGDGDLEVEVINQAIGVNNLVLALTGKYYDAAGDEQTDSYMSCTIPSTSVVGTRVAVTVGVDSARYHDITAVTNSNGTNGDDIKIITKLDRNIRRS